MHKKLKLFSLELQLITMAIVSLGLMTVSGNPIEPSNYTRMEGNYENKKELCKILQSMQTLPRPHIICNQESVKLQCPRICNSFQNDLLPQTVAKQGKFWAVNDKKWILKKIAVIVAASLLVLAAIITTVVVTTLPCQGMSYFDSIAEASARKEPLGESPSGHGDTFFNAIVNAEHCFKNFDADGDGKLDKTEFSILLKDLFRDAKGCRHSIEPSKLNEMFNIFNKSGGDGISMQEFQDCWNCWIKTIVRPVSAIIIVDVQNDFITGTLAIKDYPAKEDGIDTVPPINNMLDTVPFDNIYYTQDWHPTDHISFFDNLDLPGHEFDEDSAVQNKSEAKLFDNVVFKGPPKTDQTLWPRHCVQGSEGAKFHADLKIHPQGTIIQKGDNPKIDSYSGFFDNGKLAKTALEDKLRSKGVTDVYTCGIATDVCVAFTANDAQDLGFRTVLIEDAAKGIFPEKIASTKESIKTKNGLVIDSSKVKEMVEARNRPVELGYQRALQCKAAK